MKQIEKRISTLETVLVAPASPKPTLDHSKLTIDLKRKILQHLDGERELTETEFEQVLSARIDGGAVAE
jgi:hypothetical protein